MNPHLTRARLRKPTGPGAAATSGMMISTLFRRRPRTGAPRTPRTPAGAVVWAVGDVHGRLDLVKPLVEAVLADADQVAADRKVVIFLGDYVDRGPDSRGVIRFLAGLPRDRGVEWRFLRGNHEEAMLDFLDDPSGGARWCEYGGDAALRSYGLRPPELAHRTEAWARVAADLAHRLTPGERAFLEDLELSVSIGDYFFAHAGARPGQPLERQTGRDLMWIRNSFLDSDVEFEKIVVHGHTPTDEVYVDRRRIGLDTRAYESGVLSAARFEGSGRALIQAVEDGDGAVRICATALEAAGAVAG
ncbi:metallophosphoesterase family protein [uncultured Brevundimonas sp.]|uniref:metallophosphoesterase family protein n=1 Tax=uncultured Brevundimonas sp. TaxID=213418 RepID=UPI002601E7C4|nr:metallophosphoesterase family protein [uncultured Brevundimonas sp.]